VCRWRMSAGEGKCGAGGVMRMKTKNESETTSAMVDDQD
jgi:hypothetical protein